MRIGINLLYLKPGRGTETYARGLLRGLAQYSNDIQFTLFVNKETGAAGTFKEWPNVVCPIKAKFRVMRYAWEQLILPQQVRRLRLDLLHSLGYVQPLRLPCKSVVTIHDVNFYNIGYLMSPIRRAALQYFVAWSAKSADHIITVSEVSKRQIVDLLKVSPENVTVIYNAPREISVHPVDFEGLYHKYNIISRPYIFALSSRSPHKNIGNLIRAFELLKKKGVRGLKLVLAGFIPERGEDLCKMRRDSEFRDDIIFTGYVSDDVLAGLYANAEVFVFPSLYEGFGIPVLEAFQYGAAVACSNRAALPEVAGEAALYFDPTDVAEMADVISELLCNENLRESLKKKGKERVAQFTWEKAAQKTLEIYRRVLENS